MRRRRWLISAAALVAVLTVGLAIERLSHGYGSGLGRGVHFRTLVTRASPTAPASTMRLQVVEEWVSFAPLRWRAEILDLTPISRRARGGSTLLHVPTKVIFLYDGEHVTVLNEAEREAYTVEPFLAAKARTAQHPLLFPEDFGLSAIAGKEERETPSSSMTFSGDGFSSVILEKDVSLPPSIFEVPAAYRRGGVVHTLQELVDCSGLSLSVTEYAPGAYLPMPPLRDLREAAEAAQDPAREAQARYLLGMKLLTRHDYAGAEKELKAAAILTPEDTAPRNALGLLYEMWGKPLAAIAEFEAVVSLDPQDRLAWKSLARLYRSQRRDEDANRALQHSQGLPSKANTD